jgi:hypothetical protein
MTYLDDEAIDGAVERGRPIELAPRTGITYAAFTDPALFAPPSETAKQIPRPT